MKLFDQDRREHGAIQIILDGKIVVSTHNEIVNSSRTIKAASLIGGPSSDFLASMNIGFTGDATPQTVLVTQTGLVNPLLSIAIGPSIDPRPYVQDASDLSAFGSVVVWTGIIPIATAITFDEAGLFSQGGYLWSRATFGAIQKPAGTTLSIRWEISF
jgi:hypothetical protein